VMTTADMKDVSMTYSSALDIARAIDDKRFDFNGMRDTLDSLVEGLSGEWEGTAQREFLTAYKKLKPKLKLISETMERYSTEIRATVAAEEEQEQASASGFHGISSWFMPSGIGPDNQKSGKEGGTCKPKVPVKKQSGKEKGAKQSEEKEKENGSEVTPSVTQPELTTSTQLHANMGGYSVKQGDYSYFTQPYGYNAGCCAVAYAAGISIVTGQPCDPTQFWYDGYTHYDAGHRTEWQSYDSERIYNELKNGHPFQLAYIYSTSPLEQTDADHFVLVTGVREGADVKNLQYSDFIALDPATGREVPLNETWKFNPDRVTGGFTLY